MKYLFTETVPQAKTLARTCNPQTSKDAAEKMVNSGKLNRQEKDVYHRVIQFIAYFRNPDDFTAKEISAGSAIGYYTVQRRLSGLERKDKIELIQTGVKVTYTKSIPSLRIEKPIYKRRDGCRVWRLK